MKSGSSSLHGADVHGSNTAQEIVVQDGSACAAFHTTGCRADLLSLGVSFPGCSWLFVLASPNSVSSALTWWF